MQFSDTSKQHEHDVEAIFARAEKVNYAWLTGTEAGPGSGLLTNLLQNIGPKHGFRMWVPSAHHGEAGQFTDAWVAVNEKFIDGRSWHTGYKLAIEGSGEIYKKAGVHEEFPKWGPRGLVHVQFENDKLGQINVASAHYLTHARDPEHSTIHGINHWKLNEHLADTITDWGKDVGRGKSLAFYAGDQNMADQHNDQPQGDTFFGGPFTSTADELKDWQNTGHGPIDVMASYNPDRRVTALKFNVLDDKEFFLNTDHFFCESIYDIAPLKHTA